MALDFIWYCEDCGHEVFSPEDHALLHPSHTYTERMRWTGDTVDPVPEILEDYVDTISGSLQDTIENTIPYIIKDSPYRLATTSTGSLTLLGINFRPDTVLDIPGWEGTLSNITTNSPTEIGFDFAVGATVAVYDIIVTNVVDNTLWAGNGVSLIEVIESEWIDLRLGGDVFTHGNGAGNDIRYRAGMGMVRDANGINFTGVNPWSSWVKLEFLGWTRGELKTIQWVLAIPTTSMMIGIGSDETDEGSTAQYAQMECQGYFQNVTTFFGLYGNNGTLGTIGSHAMSTNYSAYNYVKLKFTNDGNAVDSPGVAGVITLYGLDGAAQEYWDDETNILVSNTIDGTLGPDALNIFPSIIPREGSQRMLAVQVK